MINHMRSKTIIRWSLLLAFAVVIAACESGDSGPKTTLADGSSTTTTGQDAADDDLLAAVMDRRTLRVALEAIYKPDSFLDDAGNIIGFNPDVIEETARRLGIDGVEYVEPSFEIIVAGNWQGRWDVSIHSITITAERQDILLFTQPYLYSSSNVAIHADNTTIVDSETDLDGKIIGTCAGCAQQRYLEKDLALPGFELDFLIDDADIRPYQGGTGVAYEDLALGDGVRLDAVLAEVESICDQIESGKRIKLVPDNKVMFSEVNGLAFDAAAPDDATSLRDEIDRIIGEMHADGTLAEISMEWYGWDRTQPRGFPPACG